MDRLEEIKGRKRPTFSNDLWEAIDDYNENIDWLIEEVERLKKRCAGHEETIALIYDDQVEIDTKLEKENEALKQDKARLDWLEENQDSYSLFLSPPNQSLRDAIDVGMLKDGE
jgi:chromosome segregation ATPase